MDETRNAIPSKKEIFEYLHPNLPIERRLFISPLLDDDQIGDTAIDLRLGHRFLVPKPSKLAMLDVME